MLKRNLEDHFHHSYHLVVHANRKDPDDTETLT